MRVRLGLIAGSAIAALSGAVAEAQTPPAVWANWLTQLQTSGYTVTQGSSTITSVTYCETVVVPTFGTCFNSDPGDPYVVPLVPVGQGYVDPYFGAEGSQTLPNGTVVGQSYRLATNEAALIIVQLPPTAAYFSYQGYDFSRLQSDYKNPMSTPSPDPARGDLYASYSNSINNADIIKQAGFSFGQGYVAFIQTPNSSVSQALVSQFTASGGNASWIFTDPVGKNVKYGLDSSTDDLSVLFRYLLPENSTSGTNWLNNAANEVFVYRIDAPGSVANTPYVKQTLIRRSYNTDEQPLASDVKELSHLMAGWLAKQEHIKPTIKTSTPTTTVSNNGTDLSGSLGPNCIEKGHLCNGDEQDAIHWAAAAGKVGAGGLWIEDGVDTTTTNNTTEFSIAVEDGTLNTGVLTVDESNAKATGFTTGTLAGSAELALQTLGLWAKASPQLQAAAPNLFVRIFTRGCTTQSYCNQSFTTTVSDSVLPYNDAIVLFTRAYLLPGYTGGPNPNYVLAPDAIF